MCVPRMDWPEQVVERSASDAEGWSQCERLDKSDAEMLLDWLEVHGYTEREIDFEEPRGFIVRWRK